MHFLNKSALLSSNGNYNYISTIEINSILQGGLLHQKSAGVYRYHYLTDEILCFFEIFIMVERETSKTLCS